MKQEKNGRRASFITWGIVILVVAIGLVQAADQDWPQFRGALRDGISPETGLLDAWPENGPREVWRVPLGEGYSAISVADGRLFTMLSADHDGQPTEFAAAFDAATGKEIWRTAIGEKYDTEFGNGPRATPTVAGETVFVLGSRGDLAALATGDGSPRWKISLTETFESTMPHWGFSTSPVLHGGHLIVQGGGGEGKGYAALDPANGEVVWTAADGRPGYNSPLPVTIGDDDQVVVVAGGKLSGIDSSGKVLWAHDWPRGETHAIPLFVAPDRIYASGAEGVGAKLFRIGAGESGDEAELLWETRFMRNHFSSAVLLDGHLYGFDNATLKSIAVEDGKMAWAKRGLGKGSLILADGHLVALSDRGELLLIEATPEEYREKGRFQALEGRCWTAPVLSGGKLYLRNHEEMVVFDLKG